MSPPVWAEHAVGPGPPPGGAIMHLAYHCAPRQMAVNRPALGFGAGGCRRYIDGMADKPAPKPDDDTYSDEEAARRRDATVRAMIGMKPKPHGAHPAGAKKSGAKKERARK